MLNRIVQKAVLLATEQVVCKVIVKKAAGCFGFVKQICFLYAHAHSNFFSGTRTRKLNTRLKRLRPVEVFLSQTRGCVKQENLFCDSEAAFDPKKSERRKTRQKLSTHNFNIVLSVGYFADRRRSAGVLPVGPIHGRVVYIGVGIPLRMSAPLPDLLTCHDAQCGALEARRLGLPTRVNPSLIVRMEGSTKVLNRFN